MSTSDKTKTYVQSELPAARAAAVPIRVEGIGTRIGKVASLLGTRKNAASVAGVSPDALQRYIRDENMPPFNAVAQMCLTAGVRMEWLATGEEPMLVAEQPAFSRVADQPQAAPYKASVPTPGGVADREMNLLTDAVRIAGEVLTRFGLRERSTATQFAEVVRFLYAELANGAAEDAASAALDHIMELGRTPR